MTTATNPAVASAVSEELVKTFETLVKRAQTTEVCLAVFRCMDSYAVIPQSALNDYLTENAVDDSATTKVLPSFNGEIFSKEMLKPLSDIRREVTDHMKNVGALIGKSGTYAVPVQQHKEIMNFLEDAKNRYFNYLNGTLLANYDDIVEAHRAQLSKVVTNPAVLQALLNKVPSKQEIIDRHSCFYQFMGSKLPDRENLEQAAGEIISMAEAYKEQDHAFIGKITSLFKEFLSNFSDQDKTDARLGKKLSAFVKAVDSALDFEQSIRLVMVGSELEALADKSFSLLHELKQKLCVNLTQRQRKLYKDQLLSKLKLAAYVLSSEVRLQDYAEGKITVLEQNFCLNGSLPLAFASEPDKADDSSNVVSAAEQSMPDEEGTFDAFFADRAADAQTAAGTPVSAGAAMTLGEIKLDFSEAEPCGSAEIKAEPEQSEAPAEQAAKPVERLTIDDAIETLSAMIGKPQPAQQAVRHVAAQDRADLSALFH